MTDYVSSGTLNSTNSTYAAVVYQASDSVFEMVPQEPSRAESDGDEVDSLPALSASRRKAPQPFDPLSRGRRVQTVR